MRRVVLMLAAVLVGCAGHFSRVSAPPLAQPRPAGLTSGSACGMMVLGLVPVRMNSRTVRAYEEAARLANASALSDTAISTHWYWAVVGTVHCADVDGTAVR